MLKVSSKIERKAHFHVYWLELAIDNIECGIEYICFF